MIRPLVTLTEEQRTVFRQPNFAVVTTIRPGGALHASMIWVDEDNGRPVFNTTNSRAKARHLREDSRLVMVVWDRADPYRYIEVEGTAELDEQGAGGHINRLSHKYMGHDMPSRKNRVIVRVVPTRIFDYVDGAPPNPQPPGTFVLYFDCGPSWDTSLRRREQAGWDEHAQFMDRLVDEGTVVLGGPVGDGCRALVVARAADEKEVRARFADDPWIVSGVLEVGSVEPWTLWLDSTAPAPPGPT